MRDEKTMRALVVEEPQGPFQLRILPRPVAVEGQVLVRIMASGVNLLDTKIRSGKAAHARHPLPAILGIDMAGIVDAVGPGVADFDRGDEVYGMTGGVGGVQGSLAEFAAVDAALLARKPGRLSMREAAVLSLGFITAWEGLVDQARVQAGQRVLVHGGAGGVGHLAIQIARAYGAHVFATGSAGQREVIERLGAVAIDYRTSSVEQMVEAHTGNQGFDVVLDTLGGPTLDASFQAVRRHGHVVSILGWGSHSLAPLSFKAASYSGVFTLLPLLTGEGRARHGEILREAAQLAENGQLTVNLDLRHFDLGSVADAHTLLTERRASGKLVIDVAESCRA